ncbi:MAG: HAMP domain-containing histidine kinase [Polyangiaceae bacterium]|nr:HAMP domain-containing histidine kinase [Polyangiaceae bacterium]
MLPLGDLLARAAEPREMLASVVAAAVESLGADGAAVIQVLSPSEGRVVAARSLPTALEEWSGEVDAFDAELGETLLARADGHFDEVCVLPMVSSGDLFGALVLFYRRPNAPTAERLRQCEDVAKLLAMSVGKAYQLEELRSAYEQLRTAREKLERGEKLHALGEMAAGVAHDLKNILNPLSLQLQLMRRLLRREPAGSPALDCVEEMEQVVRRGIDTVERLRAFSRQSPESRVEAVDMNDLVTEALALARPRCGERVELVDDLRAAPRVELEPSEFVAALVNIIVNAIEAIGEHRGTVRVTTGEEGRRAFVRIADDGPGMPPEVQGRVFEPFFTTKGRSGTGLGLAIAFAFAQRHGGEIGLVTAVGKGATFTLAFPAVEAEKPPSTRAAPRSHRRGAR